MRLRKDLYAQKLHGGNGQMTLRKCRLCPFCGNVRPNRGRVRGECRPGTYKTFYSQHCNRCKESWWHVYDEDDGPGIVRIERKLS